MIRSSTRCIVSSVFFLFAILPAQAQTIPARLVVSSASPAPGDTVQVAVVVDLSGRTEKLGAYEAHLTWDPQVLQLVDVRDGETAPFAGPQKRVGSGELVCSQFSAQGAGGVVSLVEVRFKVIGSAGQNTSLVLSFAALDAATTFADLLPQLQVQPFTVQVAAGSPVLGRLIVSPTSPAPGDTAIVELVVDLSSRPEKLGAYEARLTWDPSKLQLVDIRDGGTGAFAGPQKRVSAGELVCSQFSAQGAGGVVSLVIVRYKVIGSAGQSTSLALSFAALDAAATFANLLPQLQVQPATLTVATLRYVRLEIRLAQSSGGLSIANKTLSLKAGTEVVFAADGVAPDGKKTSLTPAWTRVGDMGTVTSTGKFTAGRVAGKTGRVVASAAGLRDSIGVTILPAGLARLTISPAAVILKTRQTTTFRATGFDAFSNQVAVRPLWHIVGGIGSIGKKTGVFAAGTRAAAGYVIAYADSVFGSISAALTGSARVVIEQELPVSYTLHQNCPNPFNSGTTIRYELAEVADVRLVVYDLSGQEICTLYQGYQPAGAYEVPWEGLNDAGQAVASGVYLYRLEAVDRDFVETKRMTLVR